MTRPTDAIFSSVGLMIMIHTTHTAHTQLTPPGQSIWGRVPFCTPTLRHLTDRSGGQMGASTGTARSEDTLNAQRNFLFPIPGALLLTNGDSRSLRKRRDPMCDGCYREP